MKPDRPRTACAAAAQDEVEQRRRREIVRSLTRWFARSARDLPWRREPMPGRRDPWASLVSELMLQQTQVARVLEKFPEFMARFPTPTHLARADEHDVLAAWSGLGYYRRARLLHAAAKAIVEQFGGAVPANPDDLRTLPGVGRYTAGAVASIVFGLGEPIVDGNVSRVLLRLRGLEQSPADAADWCWEEATALALAAGRHVGAFNEGLMELGALVCTPRTPSCGQCPLAGGCEAFARGLTDRIPAPKRPAARKGLTAHSVVVLSPGGKVLVERRPAKGLWAGMWQTPTLEVPRDASDEAPLFQHPPADLLSLLGLGFASLESSPPTTFSHATTHRDVLFVVWHARCARAAAAGKDRSWISPADVAGLALANPQRRIIEAAFSPSPRRRGSSVRGG